MFLTTRTEIDEAQSQDDHFLLITINIKYDHVLNCPIYNAPIQILSW